MEAAADDLDRVARRLSAAGESIGAHRRQATAQWSGDASDAALAHLTDLSRGTQGQASTVAAADSGVAPHLIGPACKHDPGGARPAPGDDTLTPALAWR